MDLKTAEDRIAQLFDVLDNLNWNGDFCSECGKLIASIGECEACGSPVCSKCDHECGSSSDGSCDGSSDGSSDGLCDGVQT